MNDLELLEELKKIDTPTITNVVATYPGRPLCLEIYNPWTENWYTNNSLSCWYPEMGPIAGYAVTCTYGLPDPTFKKLTLMEVLEAMDKLGKRFGRGRAVASVDGETCCEATISFVIPGEGVLR